MHSILEFIRYPSHSRTLGLLAILAILLSIPLTVNIAQKQQELRQHAAGASACESQRGSCTQGASGPCTIPRCLNDSYAQSDSHSPNCSTSPGVSCGINDPDAPSQHYYQCVENISCMPPETPAPATAAPTAAPATQAPAPTQPPATAAPAQTVAPAAGAVSCPGNDVTTAHSGNVQVWGGSCSPSSGAKAYAIPGTCTCTVADCQLYPGTTSTYCSVNNGQSYPDPTGCNAKGANLPASCTATATPTPTPGGITTGEQCVAQQAICQSPACIDGKVQIGTCGSNSQCCKANATAAPTPTASPPSGGVPCTKPSNPNANACVAPANTCNVTSGTTTVLLDLLNDNTSNCNHQIAYFWPCTPPAPISNCPLPNICDSSNRCVNPGGTPTPTPTPNPTPPPAGSTVLTFSNIKLDGIGQNTGQPGSQNPPANGFRSATVTVLDASGNPITTLNGSILYNNGSWSTTTTISAPSATLPTGSYNFRIKTPNYISKLYSGSITGGQGNNLSNGINLPTGDINGSSGVDVNDVNILVSCSIFSKDNGAACGANSAYKGLSDLNNDGKVDQFDYNLILREFGQSDQ